ncbi:hypothetical protein PROFUN_00168 [Planoprotostelium fungivorum]|uniref:Protein kinase domain-containing protein n=1 Tax=Planoprotostelium fungivorum TaxID=1890364 RepID=A0A2P6P0U4_9EUKA|nr:hypothetical protein PROFUN_00168 [Planoprotostelium fungivorum]
MFSGAVDLPSKGYLDKELLPPCLVDVGPAANVSPSLSVTEREYYTNERHPQGLTASLKHGHNQKTLRVADHRGATSDPQQKSPHLLSMMIRRSHSTSVSAPGTVNDNINCPPSPDPAKRRWKVAYDEMGRSPSRATLNQDSSYMRSRATSLDVPSRIDEKKCIPINMGSVTLHELLGTGGSGAQVYKACADGFCFAAKILRTETVEEVMDAIKREIQIVMSLNHDNIVKYLWHEITSDDIRLYMPFYSSTLHQVIMHRRSSKNPFTETQLISYMLQISKGLYYLHSLPSPIVHRDLKAENIFVEFDAHKNISKLKIGDFDTSKILEVSSEKSFTKIGTNGYMAPEIISNKSGYSSQADVWSAGVILLEMMTLDPPFHHDSPNRMERQNIIEKGRRPTMSSDAESRFPQLYPIYLACTKRDTGKRWTAEKMMMKFRELSRYKTMQAGARTAPDRASISVVQDLFSKALNDRGDSSSSPETIVKSLLALRKKPQKQAFDAQILPVVVDQLVASATNPEDFLFMTQVYRMLMVQHDPSNVFLTHNLEMDIHSGVKRKRNGTKTSNSSSFPLSTLIVHLLERIKKIAGTRDNGLASISGNTILLNESTPDTEFLAVMLDDSAEDNERGRVELLLWEFACQSISDMLPSCRGDEDLLIDVLIRIMEAMQNYPVHPTSNEMRSISQGIDLLSRLCSPVDRYLPHYLITAHVSHLIYNTTHPSPPPAVQISQSPAMMPREAGPIVGYVHWTLYSFVKNYLLSKNNLASVLTVSDSADLCRLIGPSKEDEALWRKDIPLVHRIITDDPNMMVTSNYSSNRRSAQLYSMLREGAPIHVTKSQIMLNSELKWLHSGTTQESKSQSPFSELVVYAFLKQTLNLLSMKNANDAKDKDDVWWPEWQHLANQFYALVESNILDVERYIHYLYRNQKTEPNNGNNAIIWMINQSLSLEQVQKLFREDHLQPKPGVLVGLVNNFHTTTSDSEYRDSSVQGTIYLLNQLVKDISVTPDQKRTCETYNRSVATKFKQWRQYDIIKRKLETPNPDVNALISDAKSAPTFYIISFISKELVVNAIMDYMKRSDGAASPSTFPNNNSLTYQGRTSPLPLIPLCKIAIKARCVIFDALEAIVFGKQEGSVGPAAPGYVETYVRLLYLSPDPRKSFAPFLEQLRTNKDLARLQTLLEMLNYRLIRFLKFNGLVTDVFNAIVPLFVNLLNPQIFSGLESLVIKLSPFIDLGRRGQSEHSFFLLHLFTHGVRTMIRFVGSELCSSTYFTQPKALQFVKNVLQHLPTNSIHEKSLEFLPKQMVDAIQSVQETIDVTPRHVPVVTRDDVREEHGVTRQLLSQTAAQAEEAFVKHYSTHQNKRSIILCMLLHMVKDMKKLSFNPEIFYKLFMSFTPQEVTTYTFTFINFIMDDALAQGAPKMNTPGSRGPQIAFLQEMAGQLMKFAFVYRLVQYPTVIAAVLNRLFHDPNAVTLLDKLLSESNRWVEAVYNSGLTREHWTDDNAFTKSAELPFGKTIDPRMTLPIYYDNVVVRMIPVLDVAFMRLIEAAVRGHVTLDLNFLPVFHENPSRYVLNLLSTYYESPIMTTELKLYFLKMLDPTIVIFSDIFKSYQEKLDESVLSAPYFEKLVTSLGNVIKEGNMATMGRHGPLHMFEELPTHSQACLTSTLLEILVIPQSADVITTNLMSTLFGVAVTKILHCNISIGLMLSMLPTSFLTPFVQKMKETLKTNPVLLGNGFQSSISLSYSIEYTSNLTMSTDNDANKYLLLFQIFSHYSSLHLTLQTVKDIVADCRPITSIHQIFYVSKLLGPIVHRMNGNREASVDTIHLILSCLKDVDDDLSDMMWDQMTTTLDTSSPLHLFQLIIDLIYHLWYSSPSLSPSIASDPELVEIYQTLTPDVQWHLQHMFEVKR